MKFDAKRIDRWGRASAAVKIEREFLDSIPPNIQGVYFDLLKDAIKSVDWIYIASLISKLEDNRNQGGTSNP